MLPEEKRKEVKCWGASDYFVKKYTSSLTLALEILFLRITWLRRDRDGDQTRVKTKFVTRRDSYEHYVFLSLATRIQYTVPLSSAFRQRLPLENPVSRYILLFPHCQAGRTLRSSLATVTTVAKFPKWTQFSQGLYDYKRDNLIYKEETSAERFLL
jgi:hypothetical protein